VVIWGYSGVLDSNWRYASIMVDMNGIRADCCIIGISGDCSVYIVVLSI